MEPKKKKKVGVTPQLLCGNPMTTGAFSHHALTIGWTAKKKISFLSLSSSCLFPFLTHSLNLYSFFSHWIYVTLFSFAIRQSALSTNWCINAMLWVTQLERGCQGERDIWDEYGWGRSWVREKLWGRRGRVIPREWEGEKMGGQGKSFQLHKWLRAARQNDEWRGKK